MGDAQKAREMARKLRDGEDIGERDAAEQAADLLDALADKLEGAPLPELGPNACVSLPYTNWRGETSVRRITPLRLWFGSTEWHPERQWMLTAYDEDKGAERDFALSGFAARLEPGEDVAGLVERLESVCPTDKDGPDASDADRAALRDAAAALTTLSARAREAEARLGRWAGTIERIEAMAHENVPLDDVTLTAFALKIAEEAEARAERLRGVILRRIDGAKALRQAARDAKHHSDYMMHAAALHELEAALAALDGEGA